MTAPDPGLTDLIAAALYSVLAKAAKSGTATVDDLVASVTPVVEQHTNGQIAELEAELEKQKRGGRTIGKAIDRTLKWVIEASNSEDLIGDDGDGDWEIVWDRLFQLRPNLEAAIDRAEKAEKKVTELEAQLEKYRAEESEDLEWERFCAQQDVRCTECGLRYGERKDYTCPHIGEHKYDADDLRAALEGEQR